MRTDIKRSVAHFYRIQLILIVITAAAFYGVTGLRGCVSSILGGLVCLLPSLLFAINFFKYKGAQQTKQILSAFYLGEAMKLVLTGILFAAVFITYKVNAAAFFTTFISVQAVHWFAPCLIVKNN